MTTPSDFDVDPFGLSLFKPCERCWTLCGRDPDGLEVRHVLPCGRECELTAPSDLSDRYTCVGRCSACRAAVFGCWGLRAPCGKEGCSQCGTHAGDEYGDDLCGLAPPVSRMAWPGGKVTCGVCLKRLTASSTAAPSPAVNP